MREGADVAIDLKCIGALKNVIGKLQISRHVKTLKGKRSRTSVDGRAPRYFQPSLVSFAQLCLTVTLVSWAFRVLRVIPVVYVDACMTDKHRCVVSLSIREIRRDITFVCNFYSRIALWHRGLSGVCCLPARRR